MLAEEIVGLADILPAIISQCAIHQWLLEKYLCLWISKVACSIHFGAMWIYWVVITMGKQLLINNIQIY